MGKVTGVYVPFWVFSGDVKAGSAESSSKDVVSFFRGERHSELHSLMATRINHFLTWSSSAKLFSVFNNFKKVFCMVQTFPPVPKGLSIVERMKNKKYHIYFRKSDIVCHAGK